MKNKFNISRRVLSLLLTVALCMGLAPAAFAGQESSYHDPAEHWQTANNRTNELDANAVVTHETFYCMVCEKPTSFTIWRTPEYTRDGVTALSRNVLYSDGTMADGVSKGTILDGTPGVDAYYTGYHWTKACCETCGTLNSLGIDYGSEQNVYNLYDCATEFMEELPETVSYEMSDESYHTKTTTSGNFCVFCFGTHKNTNSVLERHDLTTEILPQPANGRFAVVTSCSLCDYASYKYVAAKSVIADYYGVVDGQPHTISVTDLAEAGVSTQIRYGNSADSCTLASAPNYTDAGQYTVYYQISYTYKDTSMTENGSANVWLRDEAPDAPVVTPGKNEGDCTHNFVLLDSVKASCLTLGYDRYLCPDCGRIERRDYTNALGHSWQGVIIREATCETDGKLMEICSRCGQVKITATPKGEHQFTTYPVAATCTSSGYTVKECKVCGEKQITDITNALPHNYKTKVTPSTCEAGGSTLHICGGCGSSFVTDYTEPLGHSWDDGTTVAGATCTGEGMTEYRCVRCGYHRLEGNTANGHVPGAPATCTEPQLCEKCGAVLSKALGHAYVGEVTDPTCTEMGFTRFTCSRCGDKYTGDYTDIIPHPYEAEITAPTCTDMGFTTYTCPSCGDSYKGDYTEPTGHSSGDWIIDREPTTTNEGEKHTECQNCGERLDTAKIEKIYLTATTDTHGEAIVGGYLVTVNDTDTKDPVSGASVTLNQNDSISILLPDKRILDYADQTTITVQLVKDKSPVADMPLSVTDKNGNSSGGKTDSAGQLTVPGTKGTTNDEGKATVGFEDNEGERKTLTVKVEDYETGRPIENAGVSISKTGKISVTLPDGVDMDEKNRITVTVTDNEKNPQEGLSVTVKADLGQTAEGKTDGSGKVAVPSVAKTERHAAYIVGYCDGSFGPELNMTRSEAAAIFARLLEAKNGKAATYKAGSSFTDIPDDAWYSGYVKYLSGFGIINGRGDGIFAPEEAITRAEFTAFAVRFFEAYGDGNSEIKDQYAGFDDVSPGYWAAEYIKDAAIRGWINGYGDGTFRADSKITRAEVVTLVNRLLGRHADETYISANYRRLNTFGDMSGGHWAFYDVMEAANTHTANVGEEKNWTD